MFTPAQEQRSFLIEVLGRNKVRINGAPAPGAALRAVVVERVERMRAEKFHEIHAVVKLESRDLLELGDIKASSAELIAATAREAPASELMGCAGILPAGYTFLRAL